MSLFTNFLSRFTGLNEVNAEVYKTQDGKIECFIPSANLAFNTSGQIFASTKPHESGLKQPDGRIIPNPQNIKLIKVSSDVVKLAQSILSTQEELNKKTEEFNKTKTEFIQTMEKKGALNPKS